MIREQIAALYGEIDLRLGGWNAGIRKVERDVQRLTRLPLSVKLALDVTGFNQQFARVQAQLRGLGAMPFPTGQMAAMNAQMATMAAHARAFNAAMSSVRVPRMPPMPGGPGRGFGTGGGGRFGGFAAGAMQGIGVPFALNPQMMAGAAVAGAGIAGLREAMRTESAAARLGGLAGISPRASAALTDRLGRIATQTPGLTRPEAFELADVLARAGVSARDLPGATGSLGRLTAVTPDADPRALAGSAVQTMNAYALPMSELGGFTQALAALDSQAVATADQILDVTRRLAGAGQAAGLSLPQTMALGAEMRSVGLPVESGSTALSRILGMSADPAQRAQWEGALGLGRGTLGAQFAADPMQALTTLFGGVRAATGRGDVNALEFIRNDLGFENQRDIMAIGQLSGRMGNVASMTDLAGQEWSSGSIMSDRLAREVGTAQSAIEELADSVRSLGSASSEASTGIVKLGAGYLSAVAGQYEGMAKFAGSLWTQPVDPSTLAPGNVGTGFEGIATPRQADLLGPFGGFSSPEAQARWQAGRPVGGDFFDPSVPSPIVRRPAPGPPDPATFLAPFNTLLGRLGTAL